MVEAYCRSFGAFLVGADLRLDDDLVELPESMVVQADLPRLTLVFAHPLVHFGLLHRVVLA